MKYGRTESGRKEVLFTKGATSTNMGIIWGLSEIGYTFSAEGDHKYKLESSFRGQLTFSLSLSDTHTHTHTCMHTRDLYA